MSARLLRRVLQEREATPQDTDVADDDQSVEEEASPPRTSARNLFDLLDDGNGDGDEEDEKEDETEIIQAVSYTEQRHSVQKKANAVPETNKKSKKKKKKEQGGAVINKGKGCTVVEVNSGRLMY